MTVKEFVDGFNEASDKEKYAKNHIVNKYVKYFNKMSICRTIVESSSFVTINNKKMFQQNTPMQYMIFMLHIISMYMDIDIDFENDDIFNCFDLLSENNLITYITSLLPEEELVVWNTVLRTSNEDFVANNRDIVSFIENKFNDFYELVGEAANQWESEKIKN